MSAPGPAWRRRLRGARLPALLTLLVVSGAGGSQAWGQDDRSDLVIDDDRLSESSALALSPLDDQLLYTVNDSGHDPVVYVVDRGSGNVVGTTALLDVDSDTDDLEALSVSGAGLLWVGDTGDNLHRRTDTALYALSAPGAGTTETSPRRHPVRYADGNPDVEAMLVDPVSGAGWLVTKGAFGGQLLELPFPVSAGAVIVPRAVPDVAVPALVTDAAVVAARPGRSGAAVLRTYGDAYVYRLPDWTPVGSFPLPRQEQGESLVALPDGRTLLAGSEGSPARVDEVTIPRRILDRLVQEPVEATAASAGTAPDPADAPVSVVAVASGVVVLLVGLLALVTRYRSTRAIP